MFLVRSVDNEDCLGPTISKPHTHSQERVQWEERRGQGQGEWREGENKREVKRD